MCQMRLEKERLYPLKNRCMEDLYHDLRSEMRICLCHEQCPNFEDITFLRKARVQIFYKNDKGVLIEWKPTKE